MGKRHVIILFVQISSGGIILYMYNMLNKDVLLFCLCESVLVNHLLYIDKKRKGCLVKNTADKFFLIFTRK